MSIKVLLGFIVFSIGIFGFLAMLFKFAMEKEVKRQRALQKQNESKKI